SSDVCSSDLLPSLSLDQNYGLDNFNDTPRPLGHSRPSPSLSGIQGDAGFVDLERTARAIAVAELARNRVPRTSQESIRVQFHIKGVLGFSWANIPREGFGRGD